MKTIALCAFGLLATAASAQIKTGGQAPKIDVARPAPKPQSKPCLCTSGEENIYSFGTNTGKTLSLCAGANEAYLVYRFGRTEKVELQYPSKLDASSWEKFTFSSYMRGGGAENAGMDLNRLTFKYREATYEIFDDWAAGETDDEPGNTSRGVEVIINGKRTTISAKPGTESGSLSYFVDSRVPKTDE